MAGRGGETMQKKGEGVRDFFIASYLKNTIPEVLYKEKRKKKITRIVLKMEL